MPALSSSPDSGNYVKLCITKPFVSTRSSESRYLILKLEPNINKSSFKPLAAIQNAARDFQNTPRGSTLCKEYNNIFTIEDFLEHVPDSICKANGFTVFESEPFDSTIQPEANLLS